MPYKIDRKRPCQTPEWFAFYAMWGRVKSEKNISHKKNYIDRGITVCERWKSLQNFVADMGTKPTPFHTLDRIDNDKGYSPDNCRWATRKEQQRNRRTTRWIEFNGERLPLCVWAERLGIKPVSLGQRLQRVPFEKAMTMRKYK